MSDGQAAMKLLLDAGLLHGDCLTVNGRTMAENLADVRVELEGQDVLYPLSAPVKPTGPISVIKDNLAPEGAVLKSSGVTVRRHTGRRACSTRRRAPCARSWTA